MSKNLTCQIYGKVNVPYTYMFNDKNGDLKLPSFVMEVVIQKENTFKQVVLDFIKYVDQCGVDSGFYKRISYFYNYVSMPKRWFLKDEFSIENLIKNYGDLYEISAIKNAIVLLKVFLSERIKGLTNEEVKILDEIITLTRDELKPFIQSFPYVEGAKAKLSKIERFIPVNIASGEIWDILPSSVKYEINNVHGLRSLIKRIPRIYKRSDETNFNEWIRRLYTDIMSEEYRNSPSVAKMIFNSKETRLIFSESKMKAIFGADYDQGFQNSIIARKFFIKYATGLEVGLLEFDDEILSKKSYELKKAYRKNLIDDATIFRVIESKIDKTDDSAYEIDELFFELVKKNRDNLREFIYNFIELKGEPENKFSLFLESFKNLNRNDLIEIMDIFANEPLPDGSYMTPLQSIIDGIPIRDHVEGIVNKNVVSLVFNPDYADIHDTTAYEFYKNAKGYLLNHPNFFDTVR